MGDQGAPGSNPRGTLFLKPCATCGELGKLVNGLDPGDPRVCVRCAQSQIQERKLDQLHARTTIGRPPSPWRYEREREDQ